MRNPATDSAKASEKPLAFEDRFIYWPTYAGAAVMLFAAFVLSWPVAAIAFSMLFLMWAPFLAFIIIISSVVVLWTIIRSAIRRQWRMAISACAFPLLLLAALPFARHAATVVDRVHFLLYENEYRDHIAHLDQKDARLAFFDWGGNAMVGLNRFVVYDESDEIMLPASKRSAQFSKRIGSDRFRNVVRLAPHFYVVDE
ncbi:hypothetical protein [Nitrobacter sp.]|uniref:hypothetical protein n=1 Tax=Nitrobacter sp. TaxID=29420 RepID=UPI00399D5C9E